MRDFAETSRTHFDPSDRKGFVACPWGREALEKGEVHILKYDGTNKDQIEADFALNSESAKGFLIQFEPEAFSALYALDDFDAAREAFKEAWKSLSLDTKSFATIAQAPIYKNRIKSRQAKKYQIVMARKSLFDDKIQALYDAPGANLKAITEDQRLKVEKLLLQAPENAYRGNAPFMPTK